MSEDNPSSLPPTTTAEQNLASLGERDSQDAVRAGQRQINLMWETTQRTVALGVIGSALAVSVILAIGGEFLGTVDTQLAAIVFLFGVANLVTGFYFGRTNHQRRSGDGDYVGR